MTLKNKSLPLIWVILLKLIVLTPSVSKAQISVDLPVNNSVFQRNSSNQATINIAGNYTSSVISSVQARLVTPGTNTPISGFNWTIIDQDPTKGQFYGSLSNVPAGWYTLQIRSVKSGAVINSTTVNRVGVGDVFLAFGQSNAQGFPGISGLSVSSEKVITHNYIDSCSVEVPNFPVLGKITSSSNIGQHGITSWYWGKLGDNLVSMNGIPVAFFNGATAGASANNFVESFSGGGTIHPFTGSQFCQGINPDNTSGVGTPYQTFLKTVRYYNSLYGIRAILWMQGESDTHLGTSLSDYQSRLSSIIARTRADFGSTIPWVISRTSWYQSTGSSNVLNGQSNLLNTGNQVFTGPTTDEVNNSNPSYSGHRDAENVHFQAAGLTEIANRWSSVLTTNIYNGNTQSFYNLSNPISSNIVPEMTYSISGSNVTVTAPGGYSSYRWVTTDNYEGTVVSTSSSLTSTGSNVYRCFMTKSNGQIVMSQKVDIGKILIQQSLAQSCPGTTYLSDLAPYSLSNDVSGGPVEFDKSNGGTADGDGTVQSLNSTTFSKGIGVYGNSEVIYRLPAGVYTTFRASIGVDDDVLIGGSIIFKVFGDGNLLYTSPTMNALSSTINIDLAVCNYTTLRLVTENSGDGSINDMGNWSDARFTCESIGTPVSLSNYKKGSKCLGLTWSAPASGSPVGYEVYLDGNLVASLSSGTFNYIFGGLSPSTSYTIGVKAVSCSGAKSATASMSVQTNGILISYSPNFNFICIGDSVTPVLDNPGGVFTITSGAEYVDYFDTNTGKVVLNGSGPVKVKYIIDQGTACYDSTGTTINGQVKPPAPAISANIDLLNTKDTLSLSSNTNCSPYNLVWSNDSTSTTFKAKLADTTSFYARCQNSFCFSKSSNIIKAKVIPDCPNSFTLKSTGADLNYGNESFDFFAKNTITATNKLFSPTGAIFKAGKNILLTPGFEAKAGSVFSATIQGCP